MLFIIDMLLNDREWMQTLMDIEDCDCNRETLLINLKLRPHLDSYKRAFLLRHLVYLN